MTEKSSSSGSTDQAALFAIATFIVLLVSGWIVERRAAPRPGRVLLAGRLSSELRVGLAELDSVDEEAALRIRELCRSDDVALRHVALAAAVRHGLSIGDIVLEELLAGTFPESLAQVLTEGVITGARGPQLVRLLDGTVSGRLPERSQPIAREALAARIEDGALITALRDHLARIELVSDPQTRAIQAARLAPFVKAAFARNVALDRALGANTPAPIIVELLPFIDKNPTAERVAALMPFVRSLSRDRAEEALRVRAAGLMFLHASELQLRTLMESPTALDRMSRALQGRRRPGPADGSLARRVLKALGKKPLRELPDALLPTVIADLAATAEGRELTSLAELVRRPGKSDSAVIERAAGVLLVRAELERVAALLEDPRAISALARASTSTTLDRDRVLALQPLVTRRLANMPASERSAVALAALRLAAALASRGGGPETAAATDARILDQLARRARELSPGRWESEGRELGRIAAMLHAAEVESLAGSDSARLRFLAVACLGGQETEEAITGLKSLAADKDPIVRLQAALRLARLGRKEAVPVLLKLRRLNARSIADAAALNLETIVGRAGGRDLDKVWQRYWRSRRWAEDDVERPQSNLLPR